MPPTVAQVLRDVAIRVLTSVTDRAGARARGDGPVDVPTLRTVDDTPRGRRAVDLGASHSPTPRSGSNLDEARDQRRLAHDDDGIPSPGQVGPAATVEVDRRELLRARITYNPELDGEPDPGEVIWTWVPYEEADGRGKDRPVLVLAREPAETLLGVYLSSRRHGGDHGWVEVGAGGWDRSGRSSWANTQRLLRIHADGMRREGDLAPRAAFDRVVHRLHGPS